MFECSTPAACILLLFLELPNRRPPFAASLFYRPHHRSGNGIVCAPCPLLASIPWRSFGGSSVTMSQNASFFALAAVAQQTAPARGVAFACPAPGAGDVSFTWAGAARDVSSPQRPPVPVRLPAFASASATLPARSAPAGSNVTLTVTACWAAAAGADPGLCGSASTWFLVAPSPLVPWLRGVNATVSEGTVELDASLSFDPDASPGPLAFRWECTAYADAAGGGGGGAGSGPCLSSEDGLPLQMPSDPATPVLRLPLLGAGGDSGGRRYAVTVAVSKADGRSAAASAFLVVINSTLPTVSVTALPAGVHANPSARTVLTGSVSSTVPRTLRTWWEHVVLPSGSPPPALDLASPAVSATGVNGSTLVLLPGALAPGRAYTLRLHASDAHGAAYAEAVVQTAGAPGGEGGSAAGQVTVTPLRGVALTTRFNVHTFGCAQAHPPTNSPLIHQSINKNLPPLLKPTTQLIDPAGGWTRTASGMTRTPTTSTDRSCTRCCAARRARRRRPLRARRAAGRL